MSVDIMLIPNIPKPPCRTFREEERGREGMYRCIAVTFIEETSSVAVQPVKVHLILLAPKEPEIADLEIAEELAIVVSLVSRGAVKEPTQIRLWMYELGIIFDEGFCLVPERWKGTGIV